MKSARIRVRGQVQGVGFRPFVWQIAQFFGIAGEVLNDPEGVLIYAHGEKLDAFTAALSSQAPPLARVDAVEVSEHHFTKVPLVFDIVASQGSGAETRVTPDAATCADCIADIFDDDPRRKGYAFTNCTHCGPRFTILRHLPYDRAETTMASFEMCSDCASEYADPADRRFHAQPVACVQCGPQIRFGDADDPLQAAAAALRAGDILAVKGLGGFHLCCDATNAGAIATLRARKRRPSKPLALMARWSDLIRYASPTKAEERALRSSVAPIALLEKALPLPDVLAPGYDRLGWMLPYTPLHHLLLDAVDRPLVMTSGNLSGEPQVIGNAEAREKLDGIVDGILDHNREIARRLDDSVLQVTRHGPMILRRARGMAPETLPLPDGFGDAPQVVAYGAHLKSAICLIKNGQALLSHHLGDLDDALTWDEFVKADADYAALFDHTPEVFACDLHPDYRSTQHADGRSGGNTFAVQHHHAHLAACLGENGWPLDGGKVTGIILDGLGLGTDGTIWGGEILLGDYHGVERLAWLKPAPLLGGDGAGREPWRNALARLDQAGLSDWADDVFSGKPRDMLRQAAAQGLNAPLSSSVGRLFDAVAAILGVCEEQQSYEGEAAMRLEALARASKGLRRYNLGIAIPIDFMRLGEIDPTAMIRAMVDGRRAGEMPQDLAFAFHLWLVRKFEGIARLVLAKHHAKAVVLSGGCFQNSLLTELMADAFGETPVLLHQKVPANDGGLALGQALIAAAHQLASR